MLVTMAILAFKIIINLLIYAVFVYRSDIFLLHCILRRTYRSNLDNLFRIYRCFCLLNLTILCTAENISFWQNNIYFNVLDS